MSHHSHLGLSLLTIRLFVPEVRLEQQDLEIQPSLLSLHLLGLLGQMAQDFDELVPLVSNLVEDVVFVCKE